MPKRKSTKKSTAQRRELALAIQNARKERSAKEQLALLDQRLGKGKGAAKERQTLKAQIETQTKGQTKTKKRARNGKAKKQESKTQSSGQDAS